MENIEQKDRNGAKSVEETMHTKEYDGRFDIDTEGFKVQMSEMEPYRLVQEIIANSFDETSVSKIDCWLEHDGSMLTMSVHDNGKGFRSIKDVFTLFRNSYKRKNVQQRGRFNLGEKEVMAVAFDGFIRSRNWKVEFYDNKRRETTGLEDNKGTTVEARFVWNSNQIETIKKELQKLIVPNKQILNVNGYPVEKKEIARTIKGELWTITEDKESLKMVRRLLETKVDVYEKEEDEVAWIFEMGIPVQKLERNLKVQWHIDVQQKIPLEIKRDVVSDSYLVDIYALLANKCYDLVPKEKAGAKWINRSMVRIEAKPAKDLLTKQYGTPKLYIPSTVDSEANEAVNKVGGVNILPNTLDRDERNHLRELQVVKLATDDFGSGLSKEYKKIEPTEEMEKYFAIVKKVAKDVIGKNIDVEVCDSDISHPAWFGFETLTYNVRFLPKRKNFFNDFTEYGIGLIVHELSHDKVPAEQEYPMPHQSPEFLSEIERIAGKIGMKGFDYWKVRS